MSKKVADAAFIIKKVFAELIAGLIPNKMARNRWRGILRYGLIRALILLWRIRNNKTAPKYYLTVCAIAKNEGPYFEEWIEWHRKMGVEKFYIYDNESTDNTKEILAPYIESGLVEYIYFPGKRRQLPAYDNCFEKNRFEARWIAVIDLDEFIFPIQDKNIPEFLKRFEDYSVVEINWLIYGSGGAKEKTQGGVMERFKRHSVPNHYLNKHVKSIINPRYVFNMIGCHEAAKISGQAADSHRNPIKKYFRNRPPQQDVIRINHYAVKSYAESIEKLARGKANSFTQYEDIYIKKYDLNDIEE